MRASQTARLVCLSGPDAGTEYELSEEKTQIGRSTSAFVTVNDGFASRQHAELHFIDNAYRLHDLESKNGVFVNGSRLSPGSTAWLEDGRRVAVRIDPVSDFTTHRPRSLRPFLKLCRRPASELIRPRAGLH